MMGISYEKYIKTHFETRPDLTPYLYHFTRRTANCNAYFNLIRLLESGIISGSDNSGYIRGTSRTSCFIDIPDNALLQYFKNEKYKPMDKRQEPYGIKTSKRFAFKKGARPVIYLPVNEANRILDPSEYWRVVRLDLDNRDDSVCFLHEREWRCKGSFKLAVNLVNVFVKTKKEAATIGKLLNRSNESFPAEEYHVKSLEAIEELYAWKG